MPPRQYTGCEFAQRSERYHAKLLTIHLIPLRRYSAPTVRYRGCDGSRVGERDESRYGSPGPVFHV